MAKARQRAAAGSQDAERVRAVMAAALAALAEGRQAGGIFPEGVSTVELKVTVGGTEVSLRAAGVGASAGDLFGFSIARTPADAAAEILKNGGIELLDFHASGNKDDATAFDNVTDTSKGKPAQRSSYGTPRA